MARKGQIFKKYSPEFKLSVILDMRNNNLGYNETMRKYNINSHTVIAFVYLKEALTNVAKESFKQCLKKLLKATGAFTESELAFV